MKNIISKELLGEVVKCKDIWSMNIYETDIYTLRYAGLENNCGGSINLFQLAHMCKEWAFNEGYVLESGNGWCNYYTNKGFNNDEKYIDYMSSNTEPEAIFKACQWILENKKGL